MHPGSVWFRRLRSAQRCRASSCSAPRNRGVSLWFPLPRRRPEDAACRSAYSCGEYPSAVLRYRFQRFLLHRWNGCFPAGRLCSASCSGRNRDRTRCLWCRRCWCTTHQGRVRRNRCVRESFHFFSAAVWCRRYRRNGW